MTARERLEEAFPESVQAVIRRACAALVAQKGLHLMSHVPQDAAEAWVLLVSTQAERHLLDQLADDPVAFFADALDEGITEARW